MAARLKSFREIGSTVFSKTSSLEDAYKNLFERVNTWLIQRHLDFSDIEIQQFRNIETYNLGEQLCVFYVLEVVVIFFSNEHLPEPKDQKIVSGLVMSTSREFNPADD